jgi:hypothetical protein
MTTARTLLCARPSRLLSFLLVLWFLAACSPLGALPTPVAGTLAPAATFPPPWTATAWAGVSASPSPSLAESTEAPTPSPLLFHVASAEKARLAFEDGSIRTLNQIMNPDRTLVLPESEPLLWGSGWCAASKEILEQNYEVMETRLFVSGFEIDPAYYVARDYGSDDPENPTFCRSYYVLIDSWPEGLTYLEWRDAIREPLYDGWGHYEPGLVRHPFAVCVGPWCY